MTIDLNKTAAAWLADKNVNDIPGITAERLVQAYHIHLRHAPCDMLDKDRVRDMAAAFGPLKKQPLVYGHHFHWDMAAELFSDHIDSLKESARKEAMKRSAARMAADLMKKLGR